MFAEIKTFSDIFLDKSKSIGLKTAIFISIVGFAIMADYTFNISYNIYVSNKLSNLESVDKLKTIYKNDSTQYANLLEIENRLLNRKHYLDFVSFHLSKIDLKSNKIDQKKPITNNEKIIKKNIIRSRLWMLLSSNYFFAILVVSLLLLPVYDKPSRKLENIFGAFAVIIILLCAMIFSTWTAYQIPLILRLPILNYILNVIIHTLFLLLTYKLSKKNN